MAGTVTVTGKVGPDQTLTAAAFTGCTELSFNMVENVITFVQDGVTKQVAITAATTITATKSGSTYTFTIS